MTNTRENARQLRPIHPNARILPFDFIDYDTDNKANALALQDAVFGETTDPASIGGGTAKLFSRLKGIQQNLEAQTSSLQNSGTFQNKTTLATFSGTPNPLSVVATVDVSQAPDSEWVLVTMFDNGFGNQITLGVSVSYDGITWNDLYNTGTLNVLIYEASGANISGVSFPVGEFTPVWIKSPFRYIRFADLGGGTTYALTIYSSTDAPFDQNAGQINALGAINSAVQLNTDEDRVYRALVAQPGINPGDVIRRSSNSFFSQPNNPSYVYWSNDTTGVLNIAVPAIAGLVPMTVVSGGQNVVRLVNSNASTLQIKLSNALIRSVYVDNLQTGIIYLGIHTGLSAAPAAGNVPVESYRIPSNGSTSIELDRVYSNGQVWLSFSSTPGAITLSPNNKNVIARFN